MKIYLLTWFIGSCFAVLGWCFVLMAKNHYTLKVRTWFLNNDIDSYDHLPEYNRMMFNLNRLSKESWKEYLKGDRGEKY